MDQLTLGLHKPSDKDLNLRVELEITNGFEVFLWTPSNEKKFASEKFQPLLQEKDNSTDEGNTSASYLYGFNSLFLRSKFIDLNNEVMSGLVNASLVVKVLQVNGDASAAAAPPAKGGKGAAPAPVAAAEEPLIQYTIPFATLLRTKGSNLSFTQPVGEYQTPDVVVNTIHESVDANQSTFGIRFFADNNLAEYVLGCRVMWWEQAMLASPPHPWSLHAPDVIDPKAKVPPTAAELRTKYLENIVKNVAGQDGIASYSLVAGGASSTEDNTNVDVDQEDEGANSAKQIQQLFPSLTFSNGKIAFNQELATEVPVEEDIRIRGDLWSISWGTSSYVFLHRNQVRRLIALISNDPSHAYVPLTMKKVPTATAVAVEGGELFATAIVDISVLVTEAGENHFDIPVSLQGDQMDVSSPQCSLTLVTNAAIVEKSVLNSFTAPAKTSKSNIPQPSTNAANTDALQELRDEISRTIERIAQEYVAIYPQANSPGTNSDGSTQPLSLDEKKSRFLEFLTSNGIFHDLQESLKPKLQLIIKDHYGARGRALGKSEIMRHVDTTAPSSSSQVSIQAILSELYVFIMKQCNIVLNSMFSNTVIQKDKGKIENPALIEDEKESSEQAFARLLRQAKDAEADSRWQVATNYHLERLQLLDHDSKLGSKAIFVHDGFKDYAEFLLHRAAHLAYSTSTLMTSTPEEVQAEYDSYFSQAREALVIASQNNANGHSVHNKHWETLLLYACVLMECDQEELAEEVMHQVISMQIPSNKQPYAIQDFANDFGGYESDQLVPVHYKAYAILATLFARQGRGLQCRKALLLANRCFEEMQDDLSSIALGSPKRTLVLILAETTCYLTSYGQGKLASTCLSLAQDCEKSCTDKATARNKAAITPPHIKYLLKRAEAEVSWMLASSTTSTPTSSSIVYTPLTVEEALQRASDSVLVSDISEDKIAAYLAEAKAFHRLRIQPDQVINSYVNAIQEYVTYNQQTQRSNALHKITHHWVPLSAFIHLGRLLMTSNRYSEVIQFLLYGSQCYNSNILCHLLGICYLRMDRIDDAEQAFLEANMLDNRQSDVWAYMCMVCILKGSHRLIEAEQCLFQTLRLGQMDTSILRELAMSFISIDKLSIAEDLIRRAISIESQQDNGSRRANAHTRKLLADVLAGQNHAAKAIDEYKAILEDETLDLTTKLQVAEKCYPLLQSLGRDEELQSVHNIIYSLRAQLEEGEGGEGVEGDVQ